MISGSSVKPPDRAQAPVQDPASKHTLAHGFANSMVARCPSYQGAIGAPKEWMKTMLRKLTNNEASAEWTRRQEDDGTGWRLERAGVLKVNLGDRKGHSITSACRAGVLRCGTTLASSAALDVANFLQTSPPPNDARSIRNPAPRIFPPPTRPISTMDSFGSSDPKTAVMRQVQQEAAMQNARMLVEVRPHV